MNMESYLPSVILSPYVSAFLVIESKDGIENRVMPDTAVMMSFRFGGKVAAGEPGEAVGLPSTTLAGLRRTSRLLHYAPGTGNVLVKFREGGAAAFFKTPLHEFFDVHESLDQLVQHHKIAEVEEKLHEAKNNLQRVAIVEQFLIAALSSRQPDLLIRNAVDQIKTTAGNIKIRSLAASLYISQDAFEKRFMKQA